MQDFRIRLLTIILLFVFIFVAITSYSSTYSSQDVRNIEQAIPLTLANWKGENLQLSDDIFRILQTQSILVRDYRNDKGEKVTLAVIYYPDNKLGFHQPESCLGGVGYTIVEERTKSIKLSNSDKETLVKWLHYQRNLTEELIYYFYETNNFVTPNYLAFRWQMFLNRVKYGQTSGALIRISTPLQSNASAEKILREFLSEAYPSLYNFVNLEP